MNLNVGFSGVAFCVQMILATSLMSSSGMQDEIIVQHVEGHASEPSCFGLEGFEVLECDVSFVREEAFEELLDLNPAVVCVHAVVKDELANALYDTLKDRYAHFYHLIPESSLYSQNALFVASQYALSDLRFTPFPIETIGKEPGRFDFVINAGKGFLKHVYTMHADSLEHRDVALEQMRLDKRSQQASHSLVFFSEDLALFRTYSRKSTLERYDSFAMITRVRPHRLVENSIKKVGAVHSNSAAIVLCADNSDDKSGKKASSSVGYNASGKVDTRGNSSAQAGVDYSRESKSGKQFSVALLRK